MTAPAAQAPDRVLGVDPGSRVTGWGVVEAARGADAAGGLRLRLVAAGTVRPRDDDPVPERLRAIHAGLAEVLTAYAPDAVAVEEAFAGINVRSALRLGEARAMALLAAAQAGRPVHELSPALVKRVVAGHGTAAKESVKAAVVRVLGLRPDDPGVAGLAVDAADALALAIAARTRLDVHPDLAGGRPVGRRGRRRRWTPEDLARLGGSSGPSPAP